MVSAERAETSREDVIVLAVVPAPWPPDPFQNDKEFLAHLDNRADQALTRTRAHLSAGSIRAECLRLRAESIAAGLLRVIEEREVSAVALGSSSTGLVGRVMLGGVAERILHATDVPVVVAPRAFHDGMATRVSRVSVAFGRSDHDSALVSKGAATAERMSAALRVVCFAVRPMAEYVGAMEPANEQLVVGQWMHRLESDIAEALAASRSSGGGAAYARTSTQVETILGQGTSWPEALHDVPWGEGDILVVGTSHGPLSRFFLGSHASKIVRNSPVPVMLLPRRHE